MTNTITYWHGCYDDSWKGTITDEAFAHPAKFAAGLINRIADHLSLPKGSVVVDPFGGVGLGGIVFASRDVQWVGCELEEKFVKLARQNFELHRRTWEGFGDPLPVIVQGDSRRLREHIRSVLGIKALPGLPVLANQADCVVSSPPYVETIVNIEKEGGTPGNQVRRDGCASSKGTSSDRYGQTPGQLGNMKPGEVDAVVSSPPYANSLTGDNTASETAAESRDKRNTPGGSLGQSQRHQGYGGKGNLGNMPDDGVDAVVSSPPYEGSTGGGGDQGGLLRGNATLQRADRGAFKDRDQHTYNRDSPDNIGNQTGDTFWQAARDIVTECYAILKPGGLAVWVTKDFVRRGQRVPFSDDWERLCVSCGFEPIERIHAQLVKRESHPSLFGGQETKTKERKSFFRRLAESKGSPPIDHEDVIVMRKR